MNAEERLFLQILADHIHGRKTALPGQALDWERLLATARDHGLSGVAYLQCREALQQQPEVLAKLHAGFTSDVFYSACRSRDFQEVSAALNDAGIPFLPMKGAVFCGYYPVPQLRTMGDIDMVIHPEDRQRTHEVMKSLGFGCTVDNHAVWTYARDVVIYEIHDHMMYEPLANQIDYRSYFDHVWDRAAPAGGSTRYELDENFHFVYLITHTAKHVINKGSGFRSFLDMALFVQSAGARLDWPWITAQLEELRLLDFTKTCFALCEMWFDVQMPIPSRKLDRRFYEEATGKTFHDGLFGLENQENKPAASAKAIRRSKLPYWLTVIGLTWRKLFPPYRDMQLIPWYAFVDGRPYLLPAAWLYRFYYCARHKLQHSKALLAEPYTSRQSIEDRESLISDWGL